MNYIIMIKDFFFFYFSCFVCFSMLVMDQVLQRFDDFMFHQGKKTRLLKDGFCSALREGKRVVYTNAINK